MKHLAFKYCDIARMRCLNIILQMPMPMLELPGYDEGAASASLRATISVDCQTFDVNGIDNTVVIVEKYTIEYETNLLNAVVCRSVAEIPHNEALEKVNISQETKR